MNRRLVKTAAVSLLVVACVIGIFIKLLVTNENPVRVIGTLTPKELAKAKRVAREQIFVQQQKPKPAWLPTPVYKHLWLPAKKIISDATHSIEIIQANTNGIVQVWYRGPEQKAYINGEEQGWFLQSVTMEKPQ
jgi:hypothetical protein